MIQWVINLLSLPILNAMVRAYEARLAAANTQDAKATELAIEEIRGEVAMRQEATKLLIAEQGHWYTAIVRPAIGLSVAFLLAKIFVYDKALGLGTTDALDTNLWNVVMVVIASYFGSVSIEKVARVFKGRGDAK